MKLKCVFPVNNILTDLSSPVQRFTLTCFGAGHQTVLVGVSGCVA